MQYVLGKGKGKTTYLTQQFLSALEEGGGAFFDFTGELDEVIASIPPERYEDVIIFDPAENIAFNPLHTTDIPTTATAVLDSLKSAWHYEGSTPILDLYTYNATASLSYTQDASLLGVIYLLTDESYRTQVQGYIKDPLLRKFWTDYDQLPQKEQRQQTLSTLNKFYALFTDPTFRNCLGHKRSSFTVTDRSIVLGTFPRNEKGSFLATLLLYYLPDFPIFLDGGHRLGPRAVFEKTNITFAHSYLDQLTHSMQEELIGTADTLICFRLSPKDAKRLEMEFDLGQTQWTLLELPNFTYHKKTHKTYPDQELPEPLWHLYNPQTLRNISRAKYARAEESINNFLGARHEG